MNVILTASNDVTRRSEDTEIVFVH